MKIRSSWLCEDYVGIAGKKNQKTHLPLRTLRPGLAPIALGQTEDFARVP